MRMMMMRMAMTGAMCHVCLEEIEWRQNITQNARSANQKLREADLVMASVAGVMSTTTGTYPGHPIIVLTATLLR